MLPVLGAASAVTFVIATVGLPAATALWIGGRMRAARLCGLVAMTCWIVTVVVFQLLLGGSLQVTGQIPADQMELLAWTFLAALPSQLPEAGPAVLIIGLLLSALVIALGATRIRPAASRGRGG